MTQNTASFALGICLGWIAFALIGFMLPTAAAALIGATVGILLAWPFRSSIISTGAVALLAPFGIMLPALAVRHVALGLGVEIPGFSSFEIAVFLAAYIFFLLAAFGRVPVDLYRYGYFARPVAGMTLLLCLYAFATGNWFLALVVVAGQGVWAAGWTSSNWFDTILHVTLVPIAAITLVMRLF